MSKPIIELDLSPYYPSDFLAMQIFSIMHYKELEELNNAEIDDLDLEIIEEEFEDLENLSEINSTEKTPSEKTPISITGIYI